LLVGRKTRVLLYNAQRLTASPPAVAALSVIFALAAADGGLLASFGASSIKASVFITSISFAVYLAARLAGPLLRDRRQRSREDRVRTAATAAPRYEAGSGASTAGAAPRSTGGADSTGTT
jgi:hypothetical protein